MFKGFIESIPNTAIITSPSNILYLTEYLADFAYVVMANGKLYYLSDSRFTIEVSTKLDKDIEFVETTALKAIDDILKLIPSGENKIYLDMDMPYRDCMALKNALKGYQIVDASPIIADMRIVKNSTEIDCIVKAQRIAENALNELKPYIKEGVSERELKYRLEYLMGMGGSEKTAFDTITAFGENSACAHAKPSDRRLRVGDIVLFDFGATYKGYRSDMTRTFVYGSMSEQIERMYTAVLNANKNAINAVKEGVVASAIDKTARDTLNDYGFGEYFTHSTGHGVGIDIHELPTLNARSETILKRGMVVTVEPGIYLPNVGGIRIEDMVAVGYGNLTNYPKELEILR